MIPLSPTSERLLVYLALQRGPVSRLLVRETLWCGIDEHRAGASLRTALWRLHPVGLVRCSASHLRLDPAVSVDLHRAIDGAQSVLRDTVPEHGLSALAVELVDIGDELLPGWYEDWVLAEREQYRLLRLNALDRLGERLLAAGLWCEVLQLALAATRAEPLRESSRRLLIQVNLRQGNIVEAVRQYQCYAELLRVEIGSRPSWELQQLLRPFLRTASATSGGPPSR
ncbi:BTAD domain-containing putative transcriptional regulator [Brachybacterium vulturis]|uniref:AfsR/SARP family transcriptional regulator n=1 Tax=Brachybacterium vulturis TaxID=2017484 RepID=UPI003735AC26